MAIYFRADGGNIIGLGMGHVYRCLKIADFMNKMGRKTVFVMKDIEGGPGKAVENGHEVLTIPRDADEEYEISFLREKCSGHVLVVDVRGVSGGYFAKLNECCKSTVYYDDLGNAPSTPKFIINPSVSPGMTEYKSKSGRTTYLVGEKYFILGRADVNPIGEPKRKIEKVLVSLGGADPANYTPGILAILGALPFDFRISLVLGPAFVRFKEVENAIRSIGKEVEVLKNIGNMLEVMCSHDLAFVAGGSTALELAYTGTPGILVPTISHECETSAYLQSKEIFCDLGDIKVGEKSEKYDKITKFWTDYDMRRTYSGNAKRFIDGKGLSRVLSETGLLTYS